MAFDNRTYNAQVMCPPYVNQSLSGKLFTISNRWIDLGVGSTGNILIATKNVISALSVHATADLTFHYDSLVVSSWSGGTVPNISNRNSLFRGITSIDADVLTDVVIEEQVQAQPALSRGVPPVPAGITIGGGEGVDVPIVLNRNFAVVLQVTNASALTMPFAARNVSDLYVIVQEIAVSSLDVGNPQVQV